MGLRHSGTIVEPDLDLEEVLAIGQSSAEHLLKGFCIDNGYKAPIIAAAFDLFTEAAAQPNVPVEVLTEVTRKTTRATHDCMEAITTSGMAHELAKRTFGLGTDEYFKHSMSLDECSLTAVRTSS